MLLLLAVAFSFKPTRVAYVLNPDPALEFTDEDLASIVILLAYAQVKRLLPADLEATGARIRRTDMHVLLMINTKTWLISATT